MRHALAAAIAISCVLAETGCGPEPYSAHGIVYDVKPEARQVLIEHDEIPHLMDAMTMSFQVDDPTLLAGLAPGQVIDFEVDVSRGVYRVVSYEVVGEAGEEEGWVRFGDALVAAATAPAYSLLDQNGESFGSHDLIGRAVLLDFIFTRCTGPCPILTSSHVAVQRALSAAVRDRSHFVSISLDPANDNPEALREYARGRGADLAHWSFLTGPIAEVDAVVKAFGVGSTRAADGTIEHMVLTFLINGDGKVVKRYLGQSHPPEEIASDLQLLVGVGSLSPAPQ